MKSKYLILTAAAVAAVVIVEVCLRSREKPVRAITPSKSVQFIPPATDKSAAARTSAKVAERMADPQYRAALDALGAVQQELAFARNKAEQKRIAYLAKHKGVDVNTNSADYAGYAAILTEIEDIDIAREANQNHIAAVIGGKIRSQAREHIGEEREAAAKFHASHSSNAVMSATAKKPAQPSIKNNSVIETLPASDEKGKPIQVMRVNRPGVKQSEDENR